MCVYVMAENGSHEAGPALVFPSLLSIRMRGDENAVALENMGYLDLIINSYVPTW
jgi:hypothetical protein